MEEVDGGATQLCSLNRCAWKCILYLPQFKSTPETQNNGTHCNEGLECIVVENKTPFNKTSRNLGEHTFCNNGLEKHY